MTCPVVSFDPMAIFQLSCRFFGAVAVEVSEGFASLLELSEELGGGALGRAVDKVEDWYRLVDRRRRAGIAMTYTPRRSPRWPCRRCRSGRSRARRTRRSGAWGHGTPWSSCTLPFRQLQSDPPVNVQRMPAFCAELIINGSMHGVRASYIPRGAFIVGCRGSRATHPPQEPPWGPGSPPPPPLPPPRHRRRRWACVPARPPRSSWRPAC